MNDRVVLITGASSGIGRAAALAFANEGDRLFLVARRREELESVAADCLERGSPDTRVGVFDLSLPGQGQVLVTECLSEFGQLDILVCNAGYGVFGPVADVPPEQMQRMWQVNYQSAYESIHTALPHLLERKSGHILLTSSIVGKRAMAYGATYSATKFAQVGLGEALWGELLDHGIGVTVICPGFTSTNFHSSAERTPGTRNVNRSFSGQEPAVVARAMVRAVELKEREVVLTGPGKFLMFLQRISPSLAVRIMRWIGIQERASAAKVSEPQV